MEATVNSKADIWRKRIDDQRASGQSVRAWCKGNDAREHSFYWWRRRLCLPRARLGLASHRRQSVKQAAVKLASNAFAQVVIHPSIAEPLRLRLAGQTRGEACVRELILPASMPVEQVARLVHAIEGAT